MCKKCVIVLLICMPFASIFAQPEVTQADLLKLVNGKGIWGMSGGSIPIDLKEAGPDQVWDFSNIPVSDANDTDLRMFKAEETPYADLYPEANYVLTNILVSDTTFKIHSYVRITEDSLKVIARVTDNSGNLNFSHSHPDHYMPIPLTYGATWQSIEIDSVDWGDQGIHVYKAIYDNIVDAYGTVTIPAGTIECLRLRADCMVVSDPADTVHHVEYTWIAKNNIFIAKATGPYRDTNPNFTEASLFERFKSIELATGVSAHTGNRPTSHILKDNYPNPFNPTTSIEYAIPASEYVRLDVFNTNGQRIKTLQAGFQMPGQFKAVWDGTDDSGTRVSSGIYIYRLKSNGTILSKRMVLMQ